MQLLSLSSVLFSLTRSPYNFSLSAVSFSASQGHHTTSLSQQRLFQPHKVTIQFPCEWCLLQPHSHHITFLRAVFSSALQNQHTTCLSQWCPCKPHKVTIQFSLSGVLFCPTRSPYNFSHSGVFFRLDFKCSISRRNRTPGIGPF